MLANAFSCYQDDIIEADGRNRRRREADEDDAAFVAQRDEECRVQAEKMILGKSEVPSVIKKENIPSRTSASRPKATGPSSLNAKTATLALSSKLQVQLPRFAAPTAATRAKSTKIVLPSTATASPRASIISRTTIGYSRGRKISATLRPGLVHTYKETDLTSPYEDWKAANERRSEDEILQELLHDHSLEAGEEGEDEVQGSGGVGDGRTQMPWEEEEEAFQLDAAVFQF